MTTKNTNILSRANFAAPTQTIRQSGQVRLRSSASADVGRAVMTTQPTGEIHVRATTRAVRGAKSTVD